jgi:FkbM family methyltransferase
MYQPLETYGLVFRSLLGRDLNEEEQRLVSLRFHAEADRPTVEQAVAQVLCSDEFIHRHREMLLGKLIPAPCVIIAQTPLGDEIFVDIRQLHLGFAMATGHYEPNETDFVRASVKRGQRVVDVGANVGYFTTMFGRLVGSTGSVHAFEPVSDTFRKLSAAVTRNGLAHIVQLHHAAVGRTSGTVEIAYDENALNTGGAHIIKDGGRSQVFRRETVNCVRIDDVLDQAPVHFVKMDIEGAEYMALEGADRMFNESRPQLMIEFNRDQLLAVSGVPPQTLLERVLSYAMRQTASSVAAHCGG